ncbi:MAG: fructose-bisphosphatase class III, partial [Ruthenibacterium sp.]
MFTFSSEAERKYLTKLAKDYPSTAAASGEIINLQAILKLPKPTEHFMSDLHGEFEAFTHILSNASGVIKEKVDRVLGQTLSASERAEFATLIYYPAQKLAQLKPLQSDLNAWYCETLYRLIDVCRMVSSKYTRSFVRKRLPKDFAYIIDELLHAHFEDHDKDLYYGRILSSILDIGRADDFIIALAHLIGCLAVFKLHIVGDIFDRGARPDIILDELMEHHSVDVQWGNHDVQWMGAAAGSAVCIAGVIHMTLSYNNLETLEDGYGINLRPLALFAEEVYKDTDISAFLPKVIDDGDYTPQDIDRVARMHKAIVMILFKLEAAVIARNADYRMQNRDLLSKIDFTTQMVTVDGH